MGTLGRDCARSVDDQQVVRVGENLWLQRLRTYVPAACQRTVSLNQDDYATISYTRVFRRVVDETSDCT